MKYVRYNLINLKVYFRKMINMLTVLFFPPGNRCQGTECCDGAIEGTFRTEKSVSRGHRESGQWKVPGHGG